MKKQKHYESPWLRYVISCLLSIFVIGLTITVPGCAQEVVPTEVEIPAHFTTYTDEAGLFSISYPPDWEPALSLIEAQEEYARELLMSIDSDLPLGRGSMVFIAGAPSEIGYDPSVRIAVESLPNINTHDAMVEAEVQGIKSVFQDYHAFSQVRTTIGGREVTLLDWEGTLPEHGRVHSLLSLTMVGEIVWIVTCQSIQEDFGKHEDEFQAIVGSLRILK